MWVARFDYEKNGRLERHCHTYYQILYILDGRGSFFLKEQKDSVSKGKLFFINPGESHGLVADEDSTIKTLDIKFLVNNDEFQQALLKIKNQIYTEEHKIRDLLQEIRQEGMNKSTLYKEFSKIYLFQILLLLLRACKEQNGESNLKSGFTEITDKELSELCEKVMSYISIRYGENLSLEEISKNTGYNKSYICQKFKEELQITPMKYLYLYRIKRAKEFMVYSDYSLKLIASMAGFSNIHHFTRCFKEIENITPGQFRKIERNGIWKDVYLNDEFKKASLRKTK